MATQDLVVVDKRHQQTEITTGEQMSTMGMLQLLVKQGADADKLKQFMDLADRHEAKLAKQAFTEAMAAFKSHNIHVSKDKDNGQYKSKYVSLGNLIATVTPYLSQHGLSVRWDIDQTNGIKVTCIMTHVQGHSESVPMTCPPDKSGAKNPIQEIKSAITYAKACTFESITGLASTDANLDDDGNGFADSVDISEELDWIASAKDIPELQKLFANAYLKAQKAKDKNAMQAVMNAKNKRKAELL
jgi:hypothetical protein